MGSVIILSQLLSLVLVLFFVATLTIGEEQPHVPPTSTHLISKNYELETRFLPLPPTSLARKRPPKPKSPPPSPPSAPAYDHFKLVLSWPKVFCMVNSCPNPPPMYLVIHGLWPGSSTSYSDPKCDKTRIITPGQWTTLENSVLPQLERFWPSLTREANKDFWEHEWLKHGTCSWQVLGAVQYFTVTLKLYQDLKIQDLFTKVKDKLREKNQLAPITEASASRDDVVNAIKDITHFIPQIKCQKIVGKEHLLEIRLCYTATKTPQLQDCSKPLSECFDMDLYF